MAPSILSNSPILFSEVNDKNNNSNSDSNTDTSNPNMSLPKKMMHKSEPYLPTKFGDIVWRNVVIMIFLHLSAIYGLYLVLTLQTKLTSFVLWYAYAIFGGMGITAGAHRLWAHRAYKANYKMRLILTIANLIAFQNCIFDWVRDHRVHHKFTDTNADPHNSKRGFFFSHMGWLLVRKHPDVKIKGATIDMSDLRSDPIVMFQKKYYIFLMPLFCFLIPAFTSIYLLNESIRITWFSCIAMRYVLTLHGTWLVNSAAHKWGSKPMDRAIPPSDNAFVAIIAFGEGWHNYHHVFPWDYKTAELGNYRYNITTAFIDFFAKIRWAHNLKTVSPEVIEARAARTGDGSRLPKHQHTLIQHSAEDSRHTEKIGSNLIYGWNDVDLDENDKKYATILNREQ